MKKRVWKVVCIVWALVIAFVFLHHYPNQTHYHRFNTLLVAFIEMWQQGYVNEGVVGKLNFFNVGEPLADQSLSGSGQYTIQSVSTFPNIIVLFLMVTEVSGLDQVDFLIFPVGPFILPIIIIAFVNKAIKTLEDSPTSNLLLGLFVIYLLVYFASDKVFRASYTSAWTIPLFYLTLISVFYLLVDEYRRQFYVIGAVTVISLTFWWHSMAIITVILVCSIICAGVLFKIPFSITDKEYPVPLKPVSLFGLTAGIIFTTFNQLWSIGVISSFFVASSPIDSFITAITNILTGLESHPVPYEFNYRSLALGEVYFNSHLFIHIIGGIVIVITVLWGLYAYLYKDVDQKVAILTLLLCFSAGISQVIFSVLYSATGVGFWYVPYLFVLFPILLAVATEFPHARTVFTVVLLAVIVLAMMMTVSSTATGELGYTPETTDRDIKEGFDWTYEYVRSDDPIFVDFSMFGKYIKYEAEQRKPCLEFNRLDGDSYARIVGDASNYSGYRNSYAVIDTKTMQQDRPVHSYSGRAQVVPRLYSIENNSQLHKIRIDGSVGVYRFKSQNSETTNTQCDQNPR